MGAFRCKVVTVTPEMTEAEARALLHDHAGPAGLERWIVEQPWHSTPDGWTVPGRLYGWHFELEIVAGGIRIIASTSGSGGPMVWTVGAAGARRDPL